MNVYEIPRNTKGEGRIIFIFSTKGFFWTIGGVLIGLIFKFIFNLVGLKMLGIIFVVLFGVIGFIIGTCKVPETNAFEITKKTGGENIDDVIKRFFKFKFSKGKIYLYDEDKSMEKYKTKDEGGKING